MTEQQQVIDGNNLIETLKRQRNEALDIVAVVTTQNQELQKQLSDAQAIIQDLNAKLKDKDGTTAAD